MCPPVALRRRSIVVIAVVSIVPGPFASRGCLLVLRGEHPMQQTPSPDTVHRPPGPAIIGSLASPGIPQLCYMATFTKSEATRFASRSFPSALRTAQCSRTTSASAFAAALKSCASSFERTNGDATRAREQVFRLPQRTRRDVARTRADRADTRKYAIARSFFRVEKGVVWWEESIARHRRSGRSRGGQVRLRPRALPRL